MRYCSLLPVLLLLFACRNREGNINTGQRDQRKGPAATLHTIALLPFKGADKKLTVHIKEGISKKLNAQVTVLDEMLLPASAFYKPRQRYIADSLLGFLRRENKDRFEKIIGLTAKDISTRKGDIENWGVLGLGSCPGTACVISSFRAGRSKVAAAIFRKRMVTLALHELGHTYGLQHCPDKDCLMKDAEGKMALDDADSYCSKCHNQLLRIGLLN
jgi:archaemetzincin